MAKLYAELTSDKGGRVASKGGDRGITVELFIGNTPHVHISYGYPERLYISNHKTGGQGCLCLATMKWYSAPKQPPELT